MTMTKSFPLTIAAVVSLAVLTPLKPGNANGYDLNYGGAYEVTTASLNCRYGPGTNFGIQESIDQGPGLRAQYVVNDRQNSPW